MEIKDSKKNTSSNCPFLHFPDDLLGHVASFLNLKQRSNLLLCTPFDYGSINDEQAKKKLRKLRLNTLQKVLKKVPLWSSIRIEGKNCDVLQCNNVCSIPADSKSQQWNPKTIIGDQILLGKVKKVSVSIFCDQKDEAQFHPAIESLNFRFQSYSPKMNLPPNLKRLVMGEHFDGPFGTLPLTLEYLDLGYSFDKKLEGLIFPPSLKVFKFSACFNQQVENVLLPDSLEVISFGCFFNQPVEDWKMPKELLELEFGSDFNQPIERLVLPKKLKRFSIQERPYEHFTSFNQSVEYLAVPETIQVLNFGSRMRHGPPRQLPSHLIQSTSQNLIEFVTIPKFDPSLVKLRLKAVEVPIYALNLPLGLETLVLDKSGMKCPGYNLNHEYCNYSLKTWILPQQLKCLVLGEWFNLSVTGLSLPETLEVLVFGNHFNRYFDLKLPVSLKFLSFGNEFNQNLSDLSRLSQLRFLILGSNFNQNLRLPESLKFLVLGFFFKCQLGHNVLPNNLQCLHLENEDYVEFDNYSTFPEGLEYLSFPRQSLQFIKERLLPLPNLKFLKCDCSFFSTPDGPWNISPSLKGFETSRVNHFVDILPLSVQLISSSCTREYNSNNSSQLFFERSFLFRRMYQVLGESPKSFIDAYL